VLDLSEGKTLISKAESYRDIAEFWPEADLGDYWEQTSPAEFEVETGFRDRQITLDATE
jgi:hypothetical protein